MAATKPAARNEAFNIVNGEVFRWNWMWPKLAAHLGVAAAEYPVTPSALEKQMAGMEGVWDKIVAKHGLQKNPLTSVASWWHSDADLGRVIENFTDMTKSRDKGFTAYQNSVRSFTDASTACGRRRSCPDGTGQDDLFQPDTFRRSAISGAGFAVAKSFLTVSCRRCF